MYLLLDVRSLPCQRARLVAESGNWAAFVFEDVLAKSADCAFLFAYCVFELIIHSPDLRQVSGLKQPELGRSQLYKFGQHVFNLLFKTFVFRTFFHLA